jgi:hypothetical protein
MIVRRPGGIVAAPDRPLGLLQNGARQRTLNEARWPVGMRHRRVQRAYTRAAAPDQRSEMPRCAASRGRSDDRSALHGSRSTGRSASSARTAKSSAAAERRGLSSGRVADGYPALASRAYRSETPEMAPPPSADGRTRVSDVLMSARTPRRRCFHCRRRRTKFEEPAGAGSSNIALLLLPQKLQWGPGASSSPRNAPPTGARMTLTSCAGWPDSFRTMWPVPSSTKPCPAVTTCGEQVRSSYS